MYINTHCNYSQPTLIKLDNENIGGHCTIWLRFEPDPDQSPDPGSGHVFQIAWRIALKEMDGLQSNFMDEQPVNHGRLRLISGAIRIIFGMRHPYPDLPRLLTTADFDEIWCRDGAYDKEELSKL